MDIDWTQHEVLSFQRQAAAPSPHSLRNGGEDTYVFDCEDAAALPEAKGAYESLYELGCGSYSTVMAVREKTSKRLYALKIVSKQLVVKERKVEAVMREKDILLKLRPNKFVVLLQKTFQDAGSLFFLMSLCSNEDLFFWLQRYSCLDIPCAQYYAGQIVLALEYIHTAGVVHRDLKPENILMDDKMQIKLADFGSAKMAPKLRGAFVWDNKASSFVGTAEYVAPEILSNKPASPAVDFWSLGCVLYRMLAGDVPFKAPNEYLIFQKIEQRAMSFPDHFPAVARDLIDALICMEPADRLGLGVGCRDGLKAHPFFAGLDWDTAPPALQAYLPPLTDAEPHCYGARRDPHSDIDVAARAAASLQRCPPPDFARLLDKTCLEAVRAEQQVSSPWAGYCTEDEVVVISSKATMRRGYFAEPVYVILISSARLLILSAPDLEVVHELVMREDHFTMWAQLHDANLLFLHSLRKTFYFRFDDDVAAAWVIAVQVLGQHGVTVTPNS